VLDSSDSELSPIVKNRYSDESCLDAPIVQNSVARQADDDDVVKGEGQKHLVFAPARPSASQNMESVMNSPAPDPFENEYGGASMPDLLIVRQQVGQSSFEFIERIRHAAHRRKVAMTRSRDSLVAKEEEQLRSIAEMKSKADDNALGQQRTTNPQVKQNRAETTTVKRFKARPVPPTTGALGSGGIEGVPKVEKKPTTTPFSPLLGARRLQKPIVKALQEPKPKQKTIVATFEPRKTIVHALKPSTPKEPEIRPFKARAIPKVIRSAENGGQHGIPKVEKRPLTVAISPLLGARRRSRSSNARLPAQSNTHRKCGSSISSNRSDRLTAGSPFLQGLKLVTTPAGTIVGETDENVDPVIPHARGYEPYSTRRAIKRAEYDVRRKIICEIKEAQDIQEREREVRQIRRELSVLRMEL
jgi:hypothetical protein